MIHFHQILSTEKTWKNTYFACPYLYPENPTFGTWESMGKKPSKTPKTLAKDFAPMVWSFHDFSKDFPSFRSFPPWPKCGKLHGRFSPLSSSKSDGFLSRCISGGWECNMARRGASEKNKLTPIIRSWVYQKLPQPKFGKSILTVPIDHLDGYFQPNNLWMFSMKALEGQSL